MAAKYDTDPGENWYADPVQKQLMIDQIRTPRPELSETSSVSTLAESTVEFSRLGAYICWRWTEDSAWERVRKVSDIEPLHLSPIFISGEHSPSDEQLTIVRRWTAFIRKHRVKFTGNNSCASAYTGGTGRSIDADRPVPVSGIIHPVIGDVVMTLTVEGEEIVFVDPTSGRTTPSCELVYLGPHSSENSLPPFRGMLNGLHAMCVACNDERIDIRVRRSLLCVAPLIMFDSGRYTIDTAQVSGIKLSIGAILPYFNGKTTYVFEGISYRLYGGTSGVCVALSSSTSDAEDGTISGKIHTVVCVVVEGTSWPVVLPTYATHILALNWSGLEFTCTSGIAESNLQVFGFRDPSLTIRARDRVGRCDCFGFQCKFTMTCADCTREGDGAGLSSDRRGHSAIRPNNILPPIAVASGVSQMGCTRGHRLEKTISHLRAVGVLDCGNTEVIVFGHSPRPPVLPSSYKTSIADSFDVRRICVSADAIDGLLCVAACRLFDFWSRTFCACLAHAAYVASRTWGSGKVCCTGAKIVNCTLSIPNLGLVSVVDESDIRTDADRGAHYSPLRVEYGLPIMVRQGISRVVSTHLRNPVYVIQTIDSSYLTTIPSFTVRLVSNESTPALRLDNTGKGSKLFRRLAARYEGRKASQSAGQFLSITGYPHLDYLILVSWIGRIDAAHKQRRSAIIALINTLPFNLRRSQCDISSYHCSEGLTTNDYPWLMTVLDSQLQSQKCTRRSLLLLGCGAVFEQRNVWTEDGLRGVMKSGAIRWLEVDESIVPSTHDDIQDSD